VMVAFPGALGDLFLVLPALRRLRRRHAPARLHLAVRRPLLPLAPLLGVADAWHALDDAAFARLLGSGAPPAWWPTRPRFYGWLGRGDPTLRERLRAVTSEAVFFGVVRAPGERHTALAYLGAIGETGDWPSLCADAVVAPPPSERVAGLTPVSGRRLLVHRGAGAPRKRWPDAAFRELVRRWRAQEGPVLDLLGPAEESLPPLPEAVPLREWPLPDVLSVLAAADVYLGHDSGPSHLAAAVGAHGAVLFGPTDPRAWRPLSDRLLALRGTEPARLDSLPVDDVYAALRQQVIS